MTRRSCFRILFFLTGTAFAFPPSALHAQLIKRSPLNGASLGGLSTGAITNRPVAAYTEDAAYAEIVDEKIYLITVF